MNITFCNNTVTGSSNIGIGLATPSSLLHIYDTNIDIEVDPDPEGTRILNKAW